MKVVKLGEVFEFQNGRAFNKSEWKESGIPIIRIQNLNSESAGFNYFTGDYDERIIINSGDLLFSWSGTVGTSFGPHIWKGPRALLNQHIFKVQTSESIDRQYAYLSLLNITKEIENNVSGAVGLVHIKKSKLTEFLIPLPSLNAQKVTVEKLDKAFAEIDSLEKNLKLKEEKTNQLLQSILSAAFTNTEEFDLKEVKLEDACEVVNGGTPDTKNLDYWNGNHIWITPAEMGNLTSPYINSSKRMLTEEGLLNSSAHMLPPYSVIMSSRAPIGHLVINKISMAFNQGCKGLIPKSILHHKYLYYFLFSKRDYLNSLGSGTTFLEISGSKLKSVEIPLPAIHLQQEIVEKLDKAFDEIDSLKNQISIEKELISSLRQSILNNAFSFEENVA
jgi:type I restriction enzyme S subunit